MQGGFFTAPAEIKVSINPSAPQYAEISLAKEDTPLLR